MAAVACLCALVLACATTAEAAEPEFVMPKDAQYEASAVLVSVDPEANPEEVQELLAQTPGIASQHVSAEDVQSGLISVDLEPGTDVEDAVNTIRDLHSCVLEDSQPNYIYYRADQSSPEDFINQIEVEEPNADEDEVDVASDDPDIMVEADTSQEQAGQTTEDFVEFLETQTDVTPWQINDTYKDDLWGLTSMRVYEAWALARSEGSVTVAVLDDGFDLTHEDLKDNVVEGSAYNSATQSADVSPLGTSKHGTHVLGDVGARANNGLGVAGTSYNANLWPVKVFDNNGSTSTKVLAGAIAYLIVNQQELNVRVISISIGGPVESDDFKDDVLLKAIRMARGNGIVTVVAACNADGEHPVPYYAYPSDSESVVSVMNLAKDGEPGAGAGNDASGAYTVSRATTSNYNMPGQGGADTYKGKNVSAPGNGVYGTIPNGKYSSMSGTSMATPYVAGILALEYAANPGLSVTEAIDVLYTTAKDLGDPGWDREYGWGEVDAYAAVQRAIEVGGYTVYLDIPAGGYTYDESEKKPDVTVQGPDGIVPSTNYTVTYENNVDAGTATVTIVGARAESGGFRLVKEFLIAPKPLTDQMVGSVADCEFDARALQPTVEVTDSSRAIVYGTDYNVYFRDNMRVGEATVAVVGCGNYTGTVTRHFQIKRRSVRSDVIHAELTPDTVPYTGNACKPTVRLTHEQRQRTDGGRYEVVGTCVLVEGTDYTLTYAHNTDVGTATVTVEGIGNYTDSRELTFRIVAPTVTYMAHIQTKGNQLPWRSDGKVAGTTGKSKRLEAIWIKLGSDFPISGGIQYRAHLQTTGWEKGWHTNGAKCGTTGKSRRMEAIQIRLTGELAQHYDVYYRAHVQKNGWMGWARNGAKAGTAGYARRLEAIQIVLVPKGQPAPGSTAKPFRQR